MNKLQIIEEIFGGCFTPYLKISGNREIYSAKLRLTYVGNFGGLWLAIILRDCDKAGIEAGIDLIEKEFTLTFKK